MQTRISLYVRHGASPTKKATFKINPSVSIRVEIWKSRRMRNHNYTQVVEWFVIGGKIVPTPPPTPSHTKKQHLSAYYVIYVTGQTKLARWYFAHLYVESHFYFCVFKCQVNGQITMLIYIIISHKEVFCLQRYALQAEAYVIKRFS